MPSSEGISYFILLLIRTIFSPTKVLLQAKEAS